ncbi:UPF0496 protein 4-like [Canna indica]|uniref:UPF0496 protein 4-like n=1 Tax=Canna indica TaxID=4628 RepID=A0AAQ3KK13_9LILI|nr:UPF0496 protein 4-like [Canna indica]
MSRLHDGQRAFFHFGNPFRIILPKGSNMSLKLRELLFSFEKNLAEKLKKLKPKNIVDVFSLSWMKLAIDFLSDAHNSIKTLINELQLPVSNWDEKWIDIYLDSSVKLLDICIALSSELSRLGQGQLLLQYMLHLLDFSAGDPSSEQLSRAHSYVQEWIEHVNSKSCKLQSCPAIVGSLQGILDFPKVKSSKGKVLMRALYGVRVMTVFICGIFSVILSGSSKTMVYLHACDGFFWSEVFSDLQSVVNEEITRQFAGGQVVIFNEIKAVERCASRLHNLTNTDSCEKEFVGGTNGVNHKAEIIAPGKITEVSRQRLQELVDNLADRTKQLGEELDSLSKQVNDFFQIVLVGRDALLCNLRVSAVTQESDVNNIRL